MAATEEEGWFLGKGTGDYDQLSLSAADLGVGPGCQVEGSYHIQSPLRPLDIHGPGLGEH